MIDLRESEKDSLRRRLHFEEILSDITVRLMGIPFAQVDQEIDTALMQIMEFFQVDRCALLEVQESRGFARVTHGAYADGVEQVSGEVNLVERFPWIYEQLRQGKHINMCRLEDYPEEAVTDRQSHAALGTKSVLTIPLAVDGRASRVITIHSTRRHEIWPEEYIQRLRLLGEILVNALERRQDRLQLEEQLRFEMLLADLSARFVALPSDKIDSAIVDAQRQVCECLGLDLSALWQWSVERPSIVTLAHLYRPLGGPPLPEPMYAKDHFPWCQAELEADRMINVSSMDDLPSEAACDQETWHHLGIKSVLTYPLSPGGGPPRWALSFNTMLVERTWPEPLIQRLQLIAQVFSSALARKQADEELKKSNAEIVKLQERLRAESAYLQTEIKVVGHYGEIVGESKGIRDVLAKVEQVARTDSAVLIIGETGTGKELIARAIHNLSNRKGRPMVAVNCASLPAGLVESELFGREKGAYTGALTRQMGRFEVADGSTLFLDEVAELPAELQAKLLRVLQDGKFERLGSPKTIRVNVRLIAATNHNLPEEASKGSFRRDLYYRINVFPVEIPPLRERREDIPLLVRVFVNEFCEKMGKRIQRIPKRTLDSLSRYSWPGNIRELRNVIENAVIRSQGETLEVILPRANGEELPETLTRKEFEAQHILKALEHSGWKIKGSGGAADRLGMKPATLYSMMKRLGVPTRKKRDGISS